MASRSVRVKREKPAMEVEIQPRFNIDILVWVMLAAALVISLVIRLKVAGHESPDYRFYLVHWYEHLRADGYPGFKTDFANYNFPYLYMLYAVSLFRVPTLIAIKGISVFFDYVLAFAVWWLVRGVRPASRHLPAFAAITVLFLPTVFFNSAIWGQADAIWTCFVILALGFLVRRRFNWAWFIFGVAFSIKLQAIFMLPLLAVLWLIDKRQKLWSVLLVLVVPVLAPIPAIMAGRPAKDAYEVYVDQTNGYFDTRTANFMSWLSTAGPRQVHLQWLGNMATILTMAILLIVVAGFLLYHKGRPGAEQILAMAAFLAVAVPYFLPMMRDRYFFCGEILTLVWAFLAGGRRVWLPLLVTVPMFLEYASELFRTLGQISFLWFSFSLLAAIVVLGTDAFRRPQDA